MKAAQLEIGGRRQEERGRRQEAGGRRKEAGGRRKEAGARISVFTNRRCSQLSSSSVLLG